MSVLSFFVTLKENKLERLQWLGELYSILI